MLSLASNRLYRHPVFERADMQDTKVVQSDCTAETAKVAKDGYDALLRDGDQVVSEGVRILLHPPSIVVFSNYFCW